MSVKRVSFLVVLGAVVATGVPLLWGQMSTEEARKLVTTLRPYQVLSGQVSGDFEAVYILDNDMGRLAVLKYDRTKDRLVPIAGRQLTKDFGTKENGGYAMAPVQLGSSRGLLCVTDYLGRKAIVYKVDLIQNTIAPNTPLDLDAMFRK